MLKNKKMLFAAGALACFAGGLWWLKRQKAKTDAAVSSLAATANKAAATGSSAPFLLGADPEPPKVDHFDRTLKVVQAGVGALTAVGGLVMLGLTMSEKKLNVRKLKKEVGE